MSIKDIFSKAKSFLPSAIGGAVIIGAGGLMGYGTFELSKSYLPGLTPITSGTKVVFDQPCIEQVKDKKGKTVCRRKGPITIYTLSHVKRGR